jgi:hypothetical protein
MKRAITAASLVFASISAAAPARATGTLTLRHVDFPVEGSRPVIAAEPRPKRFGP